MREYGVVYTKFWTDNDVQHLSDDAKLLFLYLFTGPHTSSSGCFRLPLAYVSADLHWNIETVSERFMELFENGFANRCQNTDWMVIPKFLKHNPIQNPNCGLFIAKQLSCLPDNFSLFPLITAMLEPFENRLPNGFMNGLRNRCQNGMANQEQEQEQEQDVRNSPSNEGLSSSEPLATEDVPAISSGSKVETDEVLPKLIKDKTPHQGIIAAYHEILPMCPQVKIWNTEQKTRLRTRWNESKDRQTIDWWREFFKRVAASDFLTGKVKDFVCDLDWLVGPKNMAKVLNGRFDPRTAKLVRRPLNFRDAM